MKMMMRMRSRDGSVAEGGGTITVRVKLVAKMLGNSVIMGAKIRLRDKRMSDVSNDYAWGMDKELTRLDAAPILNMSFTRYLREYARELRYPFLPTSQRFAIESLDGKFIGNCSCYNISEAKGEAELGIMIGDREYWSQGYGTDVVTTLVNYIFHQLKLKRIYLKTLCSNLRAQKCFEVCGFIPYKRLVRGKYRYLFMELDRERWQDRLKENGLKPAVDEADPVVDGDPA
ncbi:GNAT family N-acetyltransferase [Chloroflexota bacterium]